VAAPTAADLKNLSLPAATFTGIDDSVIDAAIAVEWEQAKSALSARYDDAAVEGCGDAALAGAVCDRAAYRLLKPTLTPDEFMAVTSLKR